ncbi:MAG TPA: pyridoxamine 5'-phosphate oxidase family protein [Candidatus Saccharimonadia bacterium]
MSKNGDHTTRAKQILAHIQYVTLATVTENGEPWNSPVARTLDAEFNVYWISDKESQHSRNVRNNGNAFIVVYDSTVTKSENKAGVYLQAQARELEDSEEIQTARELIQGPDSKSTEVFSGDGVRRIYQARPQQVWMNSVIMKDGKFVKDIRVELSLGELRAG